MLSVSSDIFRYKLSAYLSEVDVLALSGTCTHFLDYYPLEYRTKLVRKAKIDLLKQNHGKLKWDMNEQRMIGIDWSQVDQLWWDCCLKYIRTHNRLSCRLYDCVHHFVLHVMSYMIYKDVYLIVSKLELKTVRSIMLKHYNKNVVYYWPLMITSDRYDPSRITFSSLTSGKEYIAHFCTEKRLRKRRKPSDDVLIIHCK